MNTTSNTKILIVDDEIDACYLLVSILNIKKIQSACVNSLGEAESVLKEETPAIVLLDNHLKDGLGIDFIRQIKKQSPESKIVIISAQDNLSDRQKAFSNGADFFISKPYTRDIIYKTIERLNPSIIQ
jgi:two-component system, OmpR family, response regulator